MNDYIDREVVLIGKYLKTRFIFENLNGAL